MKSLLTFVCLTAVITAIPTSNVSSLSVSASKHDLVSNLLSSSPLSLTSDLDKRRVVYDPSFGQPSPARPNLAAGHNSASTQKSSAGQNQPFGHAQSSSQGSSPGQKSPAGQSQSPNHQPSANNSPGSGHNQSSKHQSSPNGRPSFGSSKQSSLIKSSSTAKLPTSIKSSTYSKPSTSTKSVSFAKASTSIKVSASSTVASLSPIVKSPTITRLTRSSTPYSSTAPSTSIKPSSSGRLSVTTTLRSTTAPSGVSASSSILRTSSVTSSSTFRSASSSVSSGSLKKTSTSSSAVATSTCAGNTANDRTKWCDFSIDTDWNEEAPNTGVTREYWLDITNITVSPDGYERVALAVNGSIPGPTIEANWGDTVKIHVKNSLTNNGTTMHWHGLRQNYTVQQDGVPSIIQCPDAPGTTHTYTWRATQYGTSWYHSHYALQAWTGVFGPIVIHGPATANYDVDLGPIMVTDWSHKTVDALWSYAQTRGPPTLDTALINGKGTFNGTGERFELAFQSGKKHRMRFINSAIDTSFKLSLDDHNMTVIAMDFVPVVPFSIDVLDITMGQRYDVIIEADQTATDYWFRAIPQASCSENDNTNDIRAIVRYSNSSTADPTTTAWNQADACVDVAYSSLVPHVSHAVVDPALQNTTLAVNVGKDTSNLFKWSIGMDSMKVIWNNPSLLQIAEGNATWETAENAYLLPDANQWVYWVIDTALPIPHPIHLHGHDFYILAQEAGATYNASTVSLNLSNPPRRDVATLPASGYLVIAFYTDNPGTWLMHCHIGWHVAEGLAVQFVERQSEIAALINATEIESTCATWKEFNTNTLDIDQDDSGV